MLTAAISIAAQAAERQLAAMQAAYDTGDDRHHVQRRAERPTRLAPAESDYFRSLTNYAKAISQVHRIKGSLLEYNGVYLTEGPWPAKAYFDARRRARARAAAPEIDYGYSYPRPVMPGSTSNSPASRWARVTPATAPGRASRRSLRKVRKAGDPARQTGSPRFRADADSAGTGRSARARTSGRHFGPVGFPRPTRTIWLRWASAA